ncbi:MAG: hypothetical protein ACYCS7_12275, partial [Acidimicrobiales bacterium]
VLVDSPYAVAPGTLFNGEGNPVSGLLLVRASLGEARLGPARAAVLMTSTPSEASTASKLAVNLMPLSG